MDAGDLIELDVTDVAHGGVFVGRHEGRVIFVPDAIPGERVRVRLTDVGKASFWRGDTLEVLDASPHRQVHVWRQADIDVAPEDRPGGADFGHIAPAYQRQLKERVLADALQRIGGFTDPSVVVAPASAPATEPDETPDGTRWRTRVSLHVDADGRVGPFAARSHRVIPVDDLPLATEALERAALTLSMARPGRVDLVQPDDGRVRVIPRPEVKRDPRGRRRAPAPAPSENGVGGEVVFERVGARDFALDAGGFWQVHRLAAHTLTQTVDAALRRLGPDGAVIDPDGWHLDLYGGVGLFAATLGDLAGPAARITSVESDPRATAHAGDNLVEWSRARAETDRVDRFVARLGAEASAAERDFLSRGVVLLDPPRSGAGRQVVEGIAALAPATVVYVACDPVALARDLAVFREAGYDTASIDALDIFPNSHHVEAVATLTRQIPPR